MITLLVGHRGVGKSVFLDSLRQYSQTHNLDWSCFDLDQEIEKREGISLAEIFKRGEPVFRDLEREVLHQLMDSAKSSTIIALGAGFEGPIPATAHVVWLRRMTDGQGRVFLNRPRLNINASPFAEYIERYALREDRYREWAHEQLILPEGAHQGLEGFLDCSEAFRIPHALTVLPENMRDWPQFWRKRSNWGLRVVEVRDDLLSKEQIQSVVTSVPANNLLYSRRLPGFEMPLDMSCVDWALELGQPPDTVHTVSLHERKDDLISTFQKIEKFSAPILKLAIEVRNFSELLAGHLWWQEDPGRRAFLPRSTSGGRWRWYRSLFGPQMPVHFVREGEGSSLDQPCLYQCILQKPFAGRFAAVLGSPVEHSRTPMEHKDYFNYPVVAVEVGEHEICEALPILRQMGLCAAAVTSPLKTAILPLLTERTNEVLQVGACNTLWLDDQRVVGHNTDVLALRDWRTELPPSQSVWLWGGGGVRTSVKLVWPEAREFSARNGSDEIGYPDLLIWATNRARDFKWPSKGVHPKLILDLNYSEDSPGLEWAVAQGLPYLSGLRMFQLQAQYQRVFWDQFLKNNE